MEHTALHLELHPLADADPHVDARGPSDDSAIRSREVAAMMDGSKYIQIIDALWKAEKDNHLQVAGSAIREAGPNNIAALLTVLQKQSFYHGALVMAIHLEAVIMEGRI